MILDVIVGQGPYLSPGNCIHSKGFPAGYWLYCPVLKMLSNAVLDKYHGRLVLGLKNNFSFSKFVSFLLKSWVNILGMRFKVSGKFTILWLVQNYRSHHILRIPYMCRILWNASMLLHISMALFDTYYGKTITAIWSSLLGGHELHAPSLYRYETLDPTPYSFAYYDKGEVC